MSERWKKTASALLLLAGFLALYVPSFRMQNETVRMEESRQNRQERAGAKQEQDQRKDAVRITHMTIDGQTDPIGIDAKELAFSWALEQDADEIAHFAPKAYQVCVYEEDKKETGSAGGSLVWDSGIVRDPACNRAAFRTDGLSDFTAYAWQVFVYDGQDTCYASPKAVFTTGFLNAEPFAGARMITMSEEENVYYEGMPVYDKSFTTAGSKKLDKAYFCISALGQYEAYLNGEKLGDAYFAPGWTDYHKRLLYRVLDVTKNVRENGENHLAVLVGTGWWAGRNAFGTYDYNRPAWIGQLILCYEDGSREVLSTDESWQYQKDTAVRDADYFNGETYDAARPDAEAISKTEPASAAPVCISDDFHGSFAAYCGPEVCHVSQRDREPETLTVYADIVDDGSDFGRIDPISVQEKDGDTPLIDDAHPVHLQKGQTLIADLGQNMTGVPSITVSGKAGDEVTILFAEMCNDSGEKQRGCDGPKGSLYRESYRSAQTTVRLLLSDTDAITYSPSLFYTGFRYLSVTATGDVTIYGLKGLFIGNESPETGFIETDQADINRLYDNTKWSQFNNFFLVATDCPQRDERLGWMGDLGSFAAASMYHADLRAFYDKWADDLMDAQTPEGAFPDTVPATIHTGWGNGGWAEAGILIPYEVYRRYGDLSYLEKLYPAMKAYMNYLAAVSDFESPGGRIGPGNIYGDWLGAQDTDSDFLCALWYGADAQIMSEVAALLGEQEDAGAYKKRKEQIISYLGERYLIPKKDSGFTQTELLFLLRYELYRAGDALGTDPEKTLSDLLAENVEKNDCKVMCGFAGTPLLLPVLCDIGREDLAYRVFLGDKNPSWMYSVRQGATTIWERYDSYTKENGFADAAMNSFDHFNEGSVAGWMYERMAGIRVDHLQAQPILIQPSIPPYEKLSKALVLEQLPAKVCSRFDSVYGMIQFDWQVSPDRQTVSFDLLLPPGASAKAVLPIEGFGEKILCGGSYHFEGKIDG
ncbi:MAG: glycoside hydrolase family 78 protein [Lachnospiraceae bacterium]|nr:glycoside hydrolase family 78 protein [Lachnospiraceae bacterium]